MAVFIVTMKNDKNLQARQNKHKEVVGHLQEIHQHNNENARNELSRNNWRGIKIINDFWINDTLIVEVENPKDVARLRRMPWVEAVEPSVEYTLPTFGDVPTIEPMNADWTWGLLDIKADQVRDEFGLDGNGVRVGVADTGITPTHRAFAGRIVTINANNSHFPGGWMDFNMSGNKVQSNPRDGHDHGTHVSGTVLGDNEAFGINIGVAPGAQLVSAGLFNSSGSTSDARVAASLQWMLNPDYGGNTTNTAPRVVNNSWGAANAFRINHINIVAAFEAAGILFTASSGNEGTGQSSSPGHDYGVFGVGATDNNKSITEWSSGRIVGKSQYSASMPASWPHAWITPRIAAPGNAVYSATRSTSDYGSKSGTSMANPHVVGACAVLLQANPDLTPTDLRRILVKTADWDDRHRPEPSLDTRFGAGRLNLYRAVKAVL